MPDDEEGYELVVPFVVCATNGGPYDDEAFVAGARWAQVDSALASGVEFHDAYVESGIVPQLELSAMQYGYAIETEVWEDDAFWTRVVLRKVVENDVR